MNLLPLSSSSMTSRFSALALQLFRPCQHCPLSDQVCPLTSSSLLRLAMCSLPPPDRHGTMAKSLHMFLILNINLARPAVGRTTGTGEIIGNIVRNDKKNSGKCTQGGADLHSQFPVISVGCLVTARIITTTMVLCNPMRSSSNGRPTNDATAPAPRQVRSCRPERRGEW